LEDEEQEDQEQEDQEQESLARTFNAHRGLQAIAHLRLRLRLVCVIDRRWLHESLLMVRSGTTRWLVGKDAGPVDQLIVAGWGSGNIV
jgi:hypothetical protein